MYPDSRQTIHVGLNARFLPTPIISSHSYLGFQQALLAQGIEFTTASFTPDEIAVIRERPARLEIKILNRGQPPVGQLLVVAPQPAGGLELFTKEVEAVGRALDSTWTGDRRQILNSDVTFRDLYEASSEHAFRELWEERLQQPAGALGVLGRPVLGGGLRFFMPPKADDAEAVHITVRIESYLKDTKKIYVETQFAWPTPLPPGVPLNPAGRLKQVDDYVEGSVVAFLLGRSP